MTYASEVLADSPLGYWKLDEASGTAADSSGNGITLSSAGTTTIGSATSPPQGGTSLNVNNGKYAAVMTAQSRPITLEAWIYPTTSAQSGAFINRGEDLGGNGVAVGVGNGTMDSDGLELIYLLNGVAWKASGYTFPATNTWYHVVVTDDATDIKFYVDGTLEATVASGTMNAMSAEIHIGRQDISARAFIGNIAHAAIYGSVLSGTRVTAHYDARSASSTAKSDTDTFTFTEGTVSISGLVAKADTDTFTAADTATLTYRTSLVATDLFRATDRDFLNYSPTPPLTVKFSGHRVYAQLANINDLTATPSPSRTFRMPTTTEDLDLYLLDENLTIIDPAGLTVTFDVGTPGVRVEGVDGDITAVSGGNGIVFITIPGGLPPGVYSCRATVNTGTEESPVYRSYPTEAITLIVEE